MLTSRAVKQLRRLVRVVTRAVQVKLEQPACVWSALDSCYEDFHVIWAIFRVADVDSLESWEVLGEVLEVSHDVPHPVPCEVALCCLAAGEVVALHDGPIRESRKFEVMLRRRRARYGGGRRHGVVCDVKRTEGRLVGVDDAVRSVGSGCCGEGTLKVRDKIYGKGKASQELLDTFKEWRSQDMRLTENLDCLTTDWNRRAFEIVAE